MRRLNDSDLICITHVKHTVKLSHTHRTQGLTLDTSVFVYLDSSFFAFGQAYVALSRVKASSQLHFLAFHPECNQKQPTCDPSKSGVVHFEPVPLPSLFKQCDSDGPSRSNIATSVPSFQPGSSEYEVVPYVESQKTLEPNIGTPRYSDGSHWLLSLMNI